MREASGLPSRYATNVKAAAYFRMSTDLQRYSLVNQAALVDAYARRSGYEIIERYIDEGKSGLLLGGRDGLQKLLRDVISGSASFSVILIADVSRWGRFQDPDESAHYEFLCRQAGVRVEYCAEAFDNDGTLGSSLVKNLKRAMAAEYSRELSRKVSAGQKRLARLGYWVGSRPGYGLRRALVDELGKERGRLEAGERKAVQAGRVVLVPGDDEELACIQNIYEMFLDQDLSMTEIARRLNERGSLYSDGSGWTRPRVHMVLTSEKYAGVNVFNRTSNPLKGGEKRNPKIIWIRREGSFRPIVSLARSQAARAKVSSRFVRMTSEQMLDALRGLLVTHGKLTAAIIDEADGVPCSALYRRRFGGLKRAYEIIGFSPAQNYGPMGGQARQALA